MTSAQPNVFTREDTFFGVCQALGDDFGFNPIFLRFAFAAGLFWNPLMALGAYAALGLTVLASRLVSPNPRFATAPEGETTEAVPQPLHADNETVADMLAVAA